MVFISCHLTLSSCELGATVFLCHYTAHKIDEVSIVPRSPLSHHVFPAEVADDALCLSTDGRAGMSCILAELSESDSSNSLNDETFLSKAKGPGCGRHMGPSHSDYGAQHFPTAAGRISVGCGFS